MTTRIRLRQALPKRSGSLMMRYRGADPRPNLPLLRGPSVSLRVFSQRAKPIKKNYVIRVGMSEVGNALADGSILEVRDVAVHFGGIIALMVSALIWGAA